MPGEILFISERPIDLAFGREIAALNGMNLLTASKVGEVEALRNAHPEMIVLWDVDHERAVTPGDPASVKLIGKALMEALPPDRVFAVSDRPLRESPYLFEIPAFGHHLYRQYSPPAAMICSKLVQACAAEEPFGVANYLPAGTPIEKIAVTRSKHRDSAVQSIESTLLKAQIPPRMATLAIQATDELIMNAIFDAPTDGAGERYRQKTPRGEDFELSRVEAVTIQIARAESYLALSISDSFGSLDKDTVLGFIRKDYRKEPYQVESSTLSAGLGIYGILGSGLSLLFISRYKASTEVILFMPLPFNFREFRQSFRFFSFILR